MALLQSSPLALVPLIRNKIWGLYCVDVGQQVFWGCVAAFSGRKFGRLTRSPGWMRTAGGRGGRAGGGIWTVSTAKASPIDNGGNPPIFTASIASAARPMPHDDSVSRTNAAFFACSRLIDNLTRTLPSWPIWPRRRAAGARSAGTPRPPFAARFFLYAGRARAVQNFEKKRFPKNRKTEISALPSICCYAGAGFRDRDQMGSGGNTDNIRDKKTLNGGFKRGSVQNAENRVRVHSAFARWLDKRLATLSADFSYVN